jgi:hypothetical protein
MYGLHKHIADHASPSFVLLTRPSNLPTVFSLTLATHLPAAKRRPCEKDAIGIWLPRSLDRVLRPF